MLRQSSRSPQQQRQQLPAWRRFRLLSLLLALSGSFLDGRGGWCCCAACEQQHPQQDVGTAAVRRPAPAHHRPPRDEEELLLLPRSRPSSPALPPTALDASSSDQEQQQLLRQLQQQEEEDDNAGVVVDDEDEPLGEVCGVPDPTVEEVQADAALMDTWLLLEGRNDDLPTGYYTVPLYFHVIHNEGETSVMSMERVQFYVDYLNSAYRDTVFYFELRDVTFSFNTDWANNGRISETETAFKRALKQGDGMESLNVYCVERLPPPPELEGKAAWTGYSYMPTSPAAGSVKDGIVIAETRDGDERRPNTLVHEVGHFLGLHHTHVGGCDAESQGDHVDDTPAHAGGFKCSNKCCEGDNYDSCPLIPGLDPVRNYLAYVSDNTCRTEFTAGQMQRMRAQYEIYRRPDVLVTRTPAETPTGAPNTEGTPIDLPTSSPVDLPTGSPVDLPTGSPVDLPTGSPVDLPTGSPVDLPTGSRGDGPTIPPVDSSTGSPVDSPTDSPGDSPTISPVDSPTGFPVNSPAGSPTEAPNTETSVSTCSAFWLSTCETSDDCCFGTCQPLLCWSIFEPPRCFLIPWCAIFG